MTEQEAWLRLTLARGVSAEACRKLLARFRTPEATLEAPHSALADVVGRKPADALAEGPDEAVLAQTLSWLEQAGNALATLGDADYPPALLETPDPPVLLYVKGNRSLLRSPMLAVVGSRNATPQGISDAEAFSKQLSNAGLTIVSGLALGIDAAAHKGGLAGEASSVAVVGTGLDRIYPARNESLARQLAEKGAVISEFPLGTPPLRENFPRRNRIISGMGKGVLVIEAAIASGSLITARLAGEQGREVFAIPGSIHSPFSKGCHALIKQGAKLVESADDVMSELAWQRGLDFQPLAVTSVAVGTGDDALLNALGHAPATLDQLCERTGQEASALLAALTTLELEGKVGQLPGGRYQRVS